MAREQTLLARIAGIGQRRSSRYSPTTEQDLDALIDSVRFNLNRLLNARHGMSQAQPDYGLPALSDLTAHGEDYLKRVQESIRGTIEKYEPRLTHVRVSPYVDETNPQTLRFRVDATLKSATGQHRVWYETSVDVGGAFDISE